MPNKKKKNAKNDFYFFMQDQKKVLAKEGQSWNTMEELVSLCNPRWRLLPERERTAYKERAKEYKENERGNLAFKFDSVGRNLLSVELEKENEKFERSQMMKRIKETIDYESNMGTLSRKRFFLVHVNYLCQVGDKTYTPCELALLKFSLKEGIMDTLHTFIRPPDTAVPIGYGYTIQKHADETHCLTMDDNSMFDPAASSYKTIIEEIMKHINPYGVCGVVEPIYTLEEDVDVVKSTLESLFSWARHPIHQDFKIYHVHKLYFEMTQTLTKNAKMASDLLAKEALKDDVRHYAINLACPYHDWHDRPRYCSLNYVKRWAYAILDHCCDSYGIPIEPLTHVHSEEREAQGIKLFHEKFLCESSKTGTITKRPEQSADDEYNMFGARKTRATPAGVVTSSTWKTDSSNQQPLPNVWPAMQPLKDLLPSMDKGGSSPVPRGGKPWSKVGVANECPVNLTNTEDFPTLGSMGRGKRQVK